MVQKKSEGSGAAMTAADGTPVVPPDVTPVVAPVADPTAVAETVSLDSPDLANTSAGWLGRLKSGLSKTGSSLSTLFVGARVDDALMEELESALLMADAGMEATTLLLGQLRQRVRDEKILDADKVRLCLKELLRAHLETLEKPFVLDAASPLVLMIAGVNGAGKTTSIGKLAQHMHAHGCSVLLAAADTFRAAAREQLQV
ncbi:MAG: signal recognition particle receptor subunit alpha, partial [Burkholderiales bacterium]